MFAQTGQADILETAIKDGACSMGEHEIAFLNTGRQKLRWIFSRFLEFVARHKGGEPLHIYNNVFNSRLQMAPGDSAPATRTTWKAYAPHVGGTAALDQSPDGSFDKITRSASFGRLAGEHSGTEQKKRSIVHARQAAML